MVRKWEFGDEVHFLRLGKIMHAESAFSRFNFDEEKSKAYIAALMSSPECMGWVLEHEGSVIGMLGGAIISPYFTKDIVAQDTIFYIHPHHRGGMGAVKMIRKMEVWAKERGALEVWHATSSEIDTGRTVCFYEKLGYTQFTFQLRKTL